MGIPVSSSIYTTLKKKADIPKFKVGDRVRTNSGHKCRVMQNVIVALKEKPDVQMRCVKVYDLDEHQVRIMQEYELQTEQEYKWFKEIMDMGKIFGK